MAVCCNFFIMLVQPLTASAARPEPGTTWHRILSFNPSANNYLRNLSRGSRVYVEANLEIREPDRDAEPGSPAATRQVFLRHGMPLTTPVSGSRSNYPPEALRVIQNPNRPRESSEGSQE
jgi:single-stranded DNA-binding protein